MSYNNGNNKKNFNNRKNGNFNKNNNRNNSQNVKKQEILEKQNKNLDMIEAAAEYLNNMIANTELSDANTLAKITMKEILNYLINDKGFAQEDTKTVSQFNYILMDLANAQRSGYISRNRIKIRILYIQERLKTSFKKELHTRIDKIMETYYHLFYWNEDNNEGSIEIVATEDSHEEHEAALVEKTMTEEAHSEEVSNNTEEVATDNASAENVEAVE